MSAEKVDQTLIESPVSLENEPVSEEVASVDASPEELPESGRAEESAPSVDIEADDDGPEVYGIDPSPKQLARREARRKKQEDKHRLAAELETERQTRLRMQQERDQLMKLIEQSQDAGANEEGLDPEHAKYKKWREQEKAQEEQKRRSDQLKIQEGWNSTLRSKHAEELQNAALRYDDFEAVITREDLPITQVMAETSMYLPDAGDFLYHLAKNEAEVRRISQLIPPLQVREMARHYGEFCKNAGLKSKANPPKPLAQNFKNDVPGVYESSSPDDTYLRMKEQLKQKSRGS